MNGKVQPFITLHLPSSFAIFGFWLTDGAQAHASIKTRSEASIMTGLRLLLRPVRGIYYDRVKASMMLALRLKSLSNEGL